MSSLQTKGVNNNNNIFISNTQQNVINLSQNQSNYQLSDFSPLNLNRLIMKEKSIQLNNYQNKDTKQKNMVNIFQNQQKHQVQRINSNSIVKRYQLVLIMCLIMSSIASVIYSTNGTFFHIKKLTDYFNLQIFGNDNLSLYEEGDNIDQAKLELTIFTDIVDHFDTLIQVLDQFDQIQGFPSFILKNQNNIFIQHLYKNDSSYKISMTTDQFQQWVSQKDLRQFVLTLKQMKIKINFGQNKRVQDLNLTLYYKTYSLEMLRIQSIIQFQPNLQFQLNKNDQSIRIIQQLLAFILLSSYLHNILKIRLENTKLKKMNLYEKNIQTLQKNRTFWCYSLLFLNLVTIFSQKYAPLASFLQILPVFQQNDSTNTNKYNFNKNLRYAVPIVLKIFIPAATLLNGFIFYSLLMYPGQYFDDYSMGFFSYFYQNFQVGTYEIFMQLQGRGNFAYLLYGILYFYMVLVANNLLPALFCTMIYIKISQKQLKNIVRRTLNNAICPQCQHINVVKNVDKQQNFQINIVSPTFSPYLKGKVSAISNNFSESNNQLTKIYVQDKQKLAGELFMKRKIQRFKLLTENLRNIIQKQSLHQSQTKYFISKINQFLNYSFSNLIYSPKFKGEQG